MKIILYMSLSEILGFLIYKLCNIMFKEGISLWWRKWYLRGCMLLLVLPSPLFINQIMTQIGIRRNRNQFIIKNESAKYLWISDYHWIYLMIGAIIVTSLLWSKLGSDYFRMTNMLKNEGDAKRDIEVRKYTIQYSNTAKTPAVFGFYRPIILMPKNKLSEEQEKMAIKHEIVHLKERDTIWNFLGLIAVGIHWFNPFAYFLMDEIIWINELFCDQSVIGHYTTEEKKSYAETIIACSTNEKENKIVSYLSKSGKKQWKRIEYILKENQRGREKYWFVMVIGLCIAILAGLGYERHREITVSKDSFFNETNFLKVSNIDFFDVDTSDLLYLDCEIYFTKTDNFWISCDKEIIMFENRPTTQNVRCQHEKTKGSYWIHKTLDKGLGCLVTIYQGYYCNQCDKLILLEKENEIMSSDCGHISQQY